MSSLKKAFDKLEHENCGTPAPVPASASVNPPASDTIASASASAVATGNEPRCLRLVASDVRAWEVPWASFYGAAFTATDACARDDALDCIELSFARFEAVLRGKHLVALMDGLHTMTLPEVRVVDRKFLGLAGNDDEPVIASIEVRKAGPS